jgi:hypothetical protein
MFKLYHLSFLLIFLAFLRGLDHTKGPMGRPTQIFRRLLAFNLPCVVGLCEVNRIQLGIWARDYGAWVVTYAHNRGFPALNHLWTEGIVGLWACIIYLLRGGRVSFELRPRSPHQRGHRTYDNCVFPHMLWLSHLSAWLFFLSWTGLDSLIGGLLDTCRGLMGGLRDLLVEHYNFNNYCY